MLFSIVAAQIYIPTNSVRGFPVREDNFFKKRYKTVDCIK